jgi:hypothetical protein
MATWGAVYRQDFESDAGLTLSTSVMTNSPLGDAVSFWLSHGASPSAGSGRLLALALELLSQIGDQLEQNQRSMLQPCRPCDLPLLKGYQRKRQCSSSEQEAMMADEAVDSDAASRIYVLAAWRDHWLALQGAPRQSLILINDAGEVAGQSVELFFGFSTPLAQGMSFPLQVRLPPCLVCHFLCAVLLRVRAQSHRQTPCRDSL